MPNPRLVSIALGGLAAVTITTGLASPAAATPSPGRSATNVAVFQDRTGRWQPQLAPTVAPQAAPAPAAPAGRGATVVQTALAQVGKPYRRLGNGPGGFDCSGLVAYAYRAAGVTVPRQSGALAGAGKRVPISQARPGDILWRPGHVGIYIGNGKMVHATYPGSTVKVDPVGKMRFAVRP